MPVAHPALVRLNDVKETAGEGDEWSEWSRVPLRGRSSRVPLERLYQRLARKMPGLPDEFERCWGHVHIWPTTFMEIYPHHIDTWQLEPRGLSKTRAWTMSLVDPDAGLRDRLARWAAHRLMHEVMAEDVEITSGVQRGVARALLRRRGPQRRAGGLGRPLPAPAAPIVAADRRARARGAMPGPPLSTA